MSPLHRRHQLAMGVALLGCTLAGAPSARAAVVAIDVSTFSGVNADLSYGNDRTISNFVGGHDLILHFSVDYVGLQSGSSSSFQFAHDGGSTNANPHNFGPGSDISAWGGEWSGGIWRTLFVYDNGTQYLSADFGASSFMGFRFGDGTNWNYGWIEVTWTWGGSVPTSSFQILAAAYESTVGGAIVTPSGAAVPLPGAAGLAAVGLVGLRGRRRR
jgi:hypothetical protein